MKSSKRLTIMTIIFLIGFVAVLSLFPADRGDTNPLFNGKKIKNFLPHMTWKEVEAALKTTDMILIPVGSIEQHGPHLPLGTDYYGATELCKLIAQETDILVAPPLAVGLSKYHMGFPGTLTLKPETFEAVLYETTECLIKYGFKRFIFYNGHGGNKVSLHNVIRKINQRTPATAVLLNGLKLPEIKNPVKYPEYDWHAGENETSFMLYLTPGLVDMTKTEKPRLTFPPHTKALEKLSKTQPKFIEVLESGMFAPKETGKKAATRDLTHNGVITTGDPKNATPLKGKIKTKQMVRAAVKFINDWKKITDK